MMTFRQGPCVSGPDERTAAEGSAAEDTAAEGAADAGDRDPTSAVAHTLREVLDRRVAEASALDKVVADDLARGLADFALSGGSRRRAALVWWGWRACGGGAAADGRDEGARERPVEGPEAPDPGAATPEMGAAGAEAPEARADDSGPADGARPGPRAVLRVAAALELIQCCALIHDDVMDGSPTRRGRPAVHVALAGRLGGRPPSGPDGAAAFGRSAAVLAGDLALAWADDLLAETALPEPVRGEVQAVWRAMRTEMVAGQYLDLLGQAAGPGGRDPGEPDGALRTAVLKSGLYSVERPLSLGAALAGAAPRVRRALGAAGRSAGLAFQLRDDLLGVFGDPRVTGKPSGDDIRTGKATHLVAVARERARRAGDRESLGVLDEALGDGGLSPAGLERVREVLVATGARAAVEAHIGRLAAACTAALEAAPLEPAARARLLSVLRAAAGHPAPPEDTR
ncbi:polyprenyl synthetase family protein [Actinacidiphila sp. DG2A-62]|uniref:polyprenyl synthetase family protein n=1 Tax=Actinacidiphila sp. DG2A-62 TaxID=3108821 RepID=UPI002DB7833F|nr:polyprenyl synthetase family protein [Actinacidiphila sp. DG2A-62]MEC3998065.1 polyprenyl synthetase family protein [Actinacidiphila sp. DG2A-62]